MYTDETAIGVTSVVNCSLEEVLVKSRDEVVSLDLTRHVMAVQSKSTSMLAHLPDGT